MGKFDADNHHVEREVYGRIHWYQRFNSSSSRRGDSSTPGKVRLPYQFTLLEYQCVHLYHYSPNLTWRDVQYLIAYTSDRDSLTNGAWHTNGAGLRVSHKFGFGAIDAEAMVTRAKRWINVPAQHNTTVQPSSSYG